MRVLLLLCIIGLFSFGVATGLQAAQGKDCKNYKEPQGNAGTHGHFARCAPLPPLQTTSAPTTSVSVPTVTLPLPTTTRKTATQVVTETRGETKTVRTPQPLCLSVQPIPIECEDRVQKKEEQVTTTQESVGRQQTTTTVEEEGQGDGGRSIVVSLIASIAGLVLGVGGMFLWCLRGM